MIRKATKSDLWHIYDLSEEFNDMYYHKPLDEVKATHMLEHMIEHGVFFVSDNGFIGGLIIPDPFRDANALVEMGWFATDSSGIKLLDAFIAEGRRLDVDEIRMCTMSTSPAVAEKIILRKGFSLAETQYRL
tara:strand:- start:2554 stop:2949 length:396 start_codon:yes stop_codon:yes gene_type:complete